MDETVPGPAGEQPTDAARAVARELLGDVPAPSVDRHRLLGELGRGGMGVVYRAHDTSLGRDVALKVLKLTGSVDRELVQRFEREARAAASLEHPNIVRVHDVGTLPDGSPYYTMELLDGQDLAHAIADGRLSQRDAVEAIRQVAQGLLYAHQRGILHRDIKPQNVFLRRDPASLPASGAATLPSGTPRPSSQVHALLLDFGLAKLAERDLASHAEGSIAGKSVQSLTRSGEIFGTPAYMSPEQSRGAKDVDARADIYSLGAALYHALVGEPPFRAPTLAELLEAVNRQDPAPPSRVDASVDADLDTLTLKCLQKDPKDRYQSAGEMAEDLRRWLDGESISARPIGAMGRLWRRARRNKAFAIPVATLSLVIILGTSTWGGIALRDRLRLRAAMSETEGLLGGGRPDEAFVRIAEARVLAPDDPEVRRLGARIQVAKGQRAAAVYAAAKARLAELEREEAQTREIPADANEEIADRLRAAHWKRGEDLKEARRRRGETWSEAVRPFHEALTQVVDQADARRALAELYWDEFERAETARDRAEEARYQKLVVDYGGPEFEARVRGEKEVRVDFLLPSSASGKGLTACLYRYEQNREPPVSVPVPFDPVGRRVLAEPSLGPWKRVMLKDLRDASRVQAARWGSAFALASLDSNRVPLPPSADPKPRVVFQFTLPRGSYVLRIPPGQGVFETRYPFEVVRDTDWKDTCELVEEAAPPTPPGMEAPPDSSPLGCWAYLPAGRYRSGGDANALTSSQRPLAWTRVPAQGTEGVFIARFEVTTGMWCAYLDDARWHAPEKACMRLPRESMTASEANVYWVRAAGAGYRPKPEYGWWTDDVPIFAISCDDQDDYCRWLTGRLGGEGWTFGLPTEDEWERAARGADGRYFPWGDTFDSAFCKMQDSRTREITDLMPEPFGLFPLDESAFGVRDMAGGTREFTCTETGDRLWRLTKGGSWSGPENSCRSGSRHDDAPLLVNSWQGMRLVARSAR
ncbi:MAG: SUMF1/EgtB/PvdO family nonheme iron enzyme [Planctomycetota bacterium]